MAELLVVAMILIVAVAYRLGGRTLISPFFLISCSFLIASVVVVALQGAWQVSLHGNTVGLIVAGLLAFGWGQSLTSGGRVGAELRVKASEPGVARPLPVVLLLGVLAFTVLTCALYYSEVSSIVRSVGDVGSGETFLGVAREARVGGEVVSAAVGHMYLVSQALSMCLLLHRVLRPPAARQLGRDILTVLPAAVYGFNTILTTGRSDLIQLAVALFVMAAVAQYRRADWSSRPNLRLLGYLGVGIVAFAAIFAGIGAARIGTVDNGGADNLAVYAGSGIAGLDYFLAQPISTGTSLWGGNTLYGVYSALRSFGYDIPQLYLPYEFRSLGGVAFTNIYTAFRRYYEDFSVVGTVAITVGMGMIYGRLWRAVIRGRSEFALLVYALLAYPLAQMAAEETFFLKVVSSGTLYELVYLAAAMWLIRAATRAVPEPDARSGCTSIDAIAVHS